MWGTGNGYAIHHVVTEIGSGLNGHRRKLMKLLADPKYTTIIVEYRDRLMRFGAEHVGSALTAPRQETGGHRSFGAEQRPGGRHDSSAYFVLYETLW
jgi:hypothetical protein